MRSRGCGASRRWRVLRHFAVIAAFLGAGAYSARCRSENAWNGFYGGVNFGGARFQGCQSALFDRFPLGYVYDDNNCANAAAVGGLQVGENVQFSRLMVGLGADADVLSVKGYREARYSFGPTPPLGGYTYSGKLGPSGLAILGGRVGYAGDFWLPYVRAGAVLAASARERTLAYTPVGAANSTATFSEGKNTDTVGWAAGGGIELVVRGAWSISAEFLRVSLGNAGETTSTCSGSVKACSSFSGISLETERPGFTANLYRIGINYRFGDWGP